MNTQQVHPDTAADATKPKSRALHEAIKSKQFREKPFDEYRDFIQHQYDGIAGARNIPINSIREAYEHLDPKKEYIVYC